MLSITIYFRMKSNDGVGPALFSGQEEWGKEKRRLICHTAI